MIAWLYDAVITVQTIVVALLLFWLIAEHTQNQFIGASDGCDRSS